MGSGIGAGLGLKVDEEGLDTHGDRWLVSVDRRFVAVNRVVVSEIREFGFKPWGQFDRWDVPR